MRSPASVLEPGGSCACELPREAKAGLGAMRTSTFPATSLSHTWSRLPKVSHWGAFLAVSQNMIKLGQGRALSAFSLLFPQHFPRRAYRVAASGRGPTCRKPRFPPWLFLRAAPLGPVGTRSVFFRRDLPCDRGLISANRGRLYVCL